MHGRLFTLFDIPFPSYFVLLAVGFLMATVVGTLWAKRIGENPDVIVDLGILMVITGVLGARLAHVLFDGHFTEYVNRCVDISQVSWKISRAECLRPMEGDWLFGGGGEPVGVWDAAVGVCRPREPDCWAALRFWEGGLTYYGGLIAASLAAYWQLRRDGFPFLRAADMAGMVVPLGLAFGRMGCSLAGCCFGTPSHLPWALTFPAHSPAADKQLELGLLESSRSAALPVHPTQLYEALGCLALAAFLLLHVHAKKRYDGQVFVFFLALYAGMRFVLEFFRSDDRGGWLGLSTSQLIGIGLALLALGMHLRLRARTA